MTELHGIAEDLCERFWVWRLSNFPEFATTVGVHKFDDRLNEFSLTAFENRKDEASLFLEETKAFLKMYDDDGSQIFMNIKLLKLQLQTFVDGSEHKLYLCPINRSDGPQFEIPRLMTYMRKETASDLQKIIARLSTLHLQIHQIIDLMREGIRRKITLNEYSIASVPIQLKNIVNQPFLTGPFGKCFQQRPKSISKDQWEIITDEANSLITNQIFPAFNKLADFINNDYMRNVRPKLAVSSLPKGRLIYQACLRYHTSTNMTPEEIHALGQKEVQRINQRMFDLCKQLNFSSLEELKKHLNADCYLDEDEMTRHYCDICNRAWKELPKFFLTLPKEKCMLKKIPKEQEQYAPTAYYKEGNENVVGTFWINTVKPQERQKYKAAALCLHEAIPGHHLQSDVFLRKKSNAKFRRFIEGGSYQMIPGRFPLYTAFMEGWGLYAEFLGEEMDIYTGIGDLFGRLLSEMLRAARLVVDTGIHAFNWSKSQAMEYMAHYCHINEELLSSEIDRYITWPGQACSYKIGELKIHELRRNTNAALGEKFDIKEFHEVVLCNGAVSLEVLESNVEKYINNKIN